MPPARLFVSLSFLGSWVYPTTAVAIDSELQPRSLQYRAPSTCHDEAGFRALVSRRNARVAWESGARPVSVEVSRDLDGTYRGQAHFAGEIEREVSARRCEEVVNALALIVAVTLDVDPNGGTTPEDTEGRPDTGGGRSSERRWLSFVGIRGSIEGSRAPGLMPTLGVFADVGQRGGLLTPRVQAALKLGGRSYGLEDQGITGAEQATFRFVGGELGACPLEIFPVAWCLGAEGGLVRVTTSEPLSVAADDRPWLAGLTGLTFDVPAGAWLVQLRGGVAVPVTRDRYEIERLDGSRQRVYHAQPAAFFGVALGHALQGAEPSRPAK